MRKLDDKQYTEFWRDVHIKTEDDLAAVCFPDKPYYFNHFFDEIQKYSLSKYVKEANLNLEGKNVLDIGCGRGRWLSFFKEKYGAATSGIDLSQEAVQICRNKGLHAYNGSVTEMPFKSGIFDLVSSITVLLHLPYQLKGKAAAEVSRVLKSGGKAILIEGTRQDTSSHVFNLSVLEWEKLFNEYGLRLVHKSAHCFNWFRLRLPLFIPLRDFLAVHLDYLVEYRLMDHFAGKHSGLALQHQMVFEKTQ